MENRSMFVGLDVHKETIDISVAEGERQEGDGQRGPGEPQVVAGVGLAAFRDTASWLKYQPDALAAARYAYAYGASQSGRFLRTFLYYGFNSDERGRRVFDGVMAHIAGASRINLNERWSTPAGLGAYNASAFPFADARLTGP